MDYKVFFTSNNQKYKQTIACLDKEMARSIIMSNITNWVVDVLEPTEDDSVYSDYQSLD
jgi:hypothetical protein